MRLYKNRKVGLADLPATACALLLKKGTSARPDGQLSGLFYISGWVR